MSGLLELCSAETTEALLAEYVFRTASATRTSEAPGKQSSRNPRSWRAALSYASATQARLVFIPPRLMLKAIVWGRPHTIAGPCGCLHRLC